MTNAIKSSFEPLGEVDAEVETEEPYPTEVVVPETEIPYETIAPSFT